MAVLMAAVPPHERRDEVTGLRFDLHPVSRRFQHVSQGDSAPARPSLGIVIEIRPRSDRDSDRPCQLRHTVRTARQLTRGGLQSVKPVGNPTLFVDRGERDQEGQKIVYVYSRTALAKAACGTGELIVKARPTHVVAQIGSHSSILVNREGGELGRYEPPIELP